MPRRGYRHTEEAKAKMSAALVGRKGRPQSLETRAKLSLALKGNQNGLGKRWSAERRTRVSIRMIGKALSAETRAKMSTAQKEKKGALNNNWKGGRCLAVGGYIRVLAPEHPYADTRGYVFEHRLVMEAHLGRTLLPTEVVHHINGIPNDNRIENLQLFSSNEEHLRDHQQRRQYESV